LSKQLRAAWLCRSQYESELQLKRGASKILWFESAAEFRSWLKKNHADSNGIWLRIFKKDSGEKSISYAEALDQALCYGWIDGQKQAHDAHSWLQKFTPRRPGSGWSKINTTHVERLIKSGQMAPAGLKAVEAAKNDGRWRPPTIHRATPRRPMIF
jgi:uncharacterized protein YdeI (YjbR/CyaY-like superfamily)